jgi:hypothetical protein
VDELEETSSGRLHVELEFFSVTDDMEKVSAAVAAQARQEVALENATKRRAGGKPSGAGKTKSDVADRKQEIMANVTLTTSTGEAGAVADAPFREDNESRAHAKPSSRIENGQTEKNLRADVSPDLAALYDEDAPDSPRHGGCFGGCFGGGPASKPKKTLPPPGADALPEVEAATPVSRMSPSRRMSEIEEAETSDARAKK